jgi:outer membrane protein OmpA-like peptidoglycan-associated protein
VQSNEKGELYAPIYSLYYPSDKWELTTENTEFLNSYVIQKIQKPNPPNLIIYIEGHTDDVGDSDYNMQLSQKRAQTVADFIKNRGFDESNIKISWHGKSQPETRKIAISKKLKDIRYANRRVTIRIVKLKR